MPYLEILELDQLLLFLFVICDLCPTQTLFFVLCLTGFFPTIVNNNTISSFYMSLRTFPGNKNSQFDPVYPYFFEKLPYLGSVTFPPVYPF